MCHLFLALVLVGILVKKHHLYKCYLKTEFYTFVTHRWMEYLSFVLVMHLLAVSFAWKEYKSMSTVFIGHFIEKGGHTHKQTNSYFINIENN